MSHKTNKKIILITGCSSGFGLLFSNELSKSSTVISTMRDLQKISNKNKDIDYLQLDVTNTQSINECIEIVKNKYGKIDVLINNAGYGIGGFFEDLSEEDIRKQFETNFFGLVNVTKAALPLLTKNKGSKIINISSIAGISSSPALSAYTSSKWAVEGLSECLYHEYAPIGLHVSSIAPGPFKTNIYTSNAKLATNFHNKNSRFYESSKRFLINQNKLVKKYLEDPKIVVKLVLKIINMKNPKYRYIVGKNAIFEYILKQVLPFNLFSKIINKLFIG